MSTNVYRLAVDMYRMPMMYDSSVKSERAIAPAVPTGVASYYCTLVVLPKYASCRPVWRTKTDGCCFILCTSNMYDRM